MDSESNIEKGNVPQWVRIGDKRSFDAIFALYWERMYDFSYRILRDEEAAKDTVQELFIDIWERRESLEVTNMGAYLRQAVRYRAASYFRKHGIPREHSYRLEALESPSSADGDLESLELGNELEKAIQKIPSRCRKVFLMSRRDRLSNNEIAQTLDISQRTVETHNSNALRLLRKELAHLLGALYLILSV